MVRRGWIIAATGLVLALPAIASAASRFSWQPGQVLIYQVEQATMASEAADGKKVETSSKITNQKRWEVLSVEPNGVATMRLTMTALRVETTTPGGEVMVFDSAKPGESNPQMRQQLARYVGGTVAVLRVDGRGKVVEVKESNHGPASRLESELPFVIVLPEDGMEPGRTWERAYRITIEPPQGTGEKYEATQKYVCESIRERFATVNLSTRIKAMPENPLDQVPLVQMQPEGGVVFNVQAGRLERAMLRVEKEIKGHQGEGSSYHFQSVYSEQYVGDR